MTTIPILDESVITGELGHLDTHNWLALLFNSYRKPDGSALYLPSDFAPPWTEFPGVALTGSSANPNVGSTGVVYGRYRELGLPVATRTIEYEFGAKFSGASMSNGLGQLYFNLPFPAVTPFIDHGMSSEPVGFGTTWRGYAPSFGDLIGAHNGLRWHIDSAQRLVGVIMAPPSVQYRPVETVLSVPPAGAPTIGGTPTDLGLTTTLTVRSTLERYRVVAQCPFYADTVGTQVSMQLTDELNNVLAQADNTAVVIGSDLTGHFPVMTRLFVTTPTLGNHTYKVRAFATGGLAKMCAGAVSTLRGTLDVEQILGKMASMAGPETDDYLSSDHPVQWASMTAGPEIWGHVFFETPVLP